MSADFWDQRVKLLRAPENAGRRSPPRSPEQVAVGPLATIIQRVADEDPDSIWRFVVVTDEGRHIRSADLRELIRRHQVRETEG